MMIERDTSLPLCVDCVHFKLYSRSRPDLSNCKVTLNYSLIDGSPITGFADNNRKFSTHCGREGRWFYPKKGVIIEHESRALAGPGVNIMERIKRWLRV